MNTKWLHIFSLLAAFLGGYLTSTFLADRGSLEPQGTQAHGAFTDGAPPQSKQMQTTDAMPVSQLQSTADRTVRFAANGANRESMAKSKPGCQCPAAEAETSEEELIAEPSEEELLAEASEEELIAQEEEEWAIAAELERIEREHAPEQADDIADDTVIELSEAELEDQRLALETAIAEEMESLQFDIPGNDADADAYVVPVDGYGTGLSEVEMEDQQFAMEDAIEVEMELLELGEDSNRTDSISLP